MGLTEWDKDYNGENLKVICKDENCVVMQIKDKTVKGQCEVDKAFRADLEAIEGKLKA